VTDEHYRPPTTDLLEPEGRTLVLASRGTRLAASIVEGLLMTLAIIPVALVGSYGLPEAWMFGSVGALLLAFLAANLVLMARHGQSVSKRMFGIRVVRTDGSRISLARYFFLRALPAQFFAQIPLLGLLDPLAIFRESRRCLHDDFADTIVVRAER
jgi:uncharacterized RDD family membrane protein YckC